MVDQRAARRRWIYHPINGGLLACIILMGAHAWERLPQKIPIHFGVNGLPDRWTNNRSELIFVFLMPFILTGVTYALGALTPYLRRHPQWVNIPNKKKFLELPAEQQEPFWSSLKEFSYGMAAAINLSLLFVIGGTLQVALGKADRLPWWSVWPGLVLLLVIIVVQIVRMFRITSRF